MLHTFVLLAMMQGAPPAPLTAPEIVERMVRADNERLAALAGYAGVRRYHFTNRKSGKQAEVTTRMTCDHAGVKTFEVISESGSGSGARKLTKFFCFPCPNLMGCSPS